jgi:hypothetical protein
MEPTITQNGALYALQHSRKKPRTVHIRRAAGRLLACLVPFAKHFTESIELIRRKWGRAHLAAKPG